MKYLKRFNKVSDYEAFKGGGDFITPNISYVDETEGLVFEPEQKRIFPIILTTTIVSGKDMCIGPNDDTIKLCEFLKENALWDGYVFHEYTFKDNEQIYIDDLLVEWIGISSLGNSSLSGIFSVNIRPYKYSENQWYYTTINFNENSLQYSEIYINYDY